MIVLQGWVQEERAVSGLTEHCLRGLGKSFSLSEKKEN